MRSRKVTFALDKSFILKQGAWKKHHEGLSPLYLVRGEMHTEAREACCWKTCSGFVQFLLVSCSTAVRTEGVLYVLLKTLDATVAILAVLSDATFEQIIVAHFPHKICQLKRSDNIKKCKSVIDHVAAAVKTNTHCVTSFIGLDAWLKLSCWRRKI